MRKYLIILIAMLITPDGNACTSSIVSGKYTPDGRPLMWKHKDTDGSGYLQWMLLLEEKIFDLSLKEMSRWEGMRPLTRQISALYKKN